ncbi:MAG: hypothetical protein M9955_16940 [Rhizobiaceae bacterium]|jgi:hypothetical protein|nr:hypothetical protein [Rhizobiaceae bacterium]
MASKRFLATALLAAMLPMTAFGQTETPAAPETPAPQAQTPAPETPSAETPAPQAPAAEAPKAPAEPITSQAAIAAAQKFCDTHLPGTIEAENATMELLTPSLRAAMDEATKKNDAWEAAHPGEKPPLGDGVPFQSYPDSPEKCVAGPAMADNTEVDIEYRFDDHLANWTDRVRLEMVDGKVLIDDVFYGVNGFEESLRSALESVGQDVEIEE